MKLATTRATRSYGARVQLERSLSVERRQATFSHPGMASAVIVRASRCTITPARSGGLAHVDEATRFVLVAASDDAAYATGTEVDADGGYLLATVDATSGPALHPAAP